MTAFRGIALALLKGFLRDRAAVFFALVFPLMFLVLFGSIFSTSSSARLDLVQIGAVPLIDDLPPQARSTFEASFDVRRVGDRQTAVAEVRKGDADVAVEMDGDQFVAHYSRADQVRAAIVQGTLAAFVDAANQAASGSPPRYSFRAQPVEDESLDAIQFLTPGLLGWAVAMSAAFGAAATLQGWRRSRLMSRLRLAPVSAITVVSARVVVTMLIALVQLAVFLALGAVAFGLRLSGWWFASVPLLVVGTLCFMSLGLLAGALAKSEEGAVNLANFFVLPMAFLSGSFFPLEGAPQWLRTVSLALPLRHLNDGMLDVLVRDEGPSSILAPMGLLAAFALAVLAAAAVAFRRAST